MAFSSVVFSPAREPQLSCLWILWSHTVPGLHSCRRDMTWTWLIVLYRPTKNFFVNMRVKKVIPLLFARSMKVQLAVRRVTSCCFRSTRHLCFTVKWFDHPEKMLEPCLASNTQEVHTGENSFSSLTSEQTPEVSLYGFPDTIYWWWIKKLSADRWLDYHSDVMFSGNFRLEFTASTAVWFLLWESSLLNGIFVTTPVKMYTNVFIGAQMILTDISLLQIYQ